MASEILTNKKSSEQDGSGDYRTNYNWPRDYEEAMRWGRGPYTSDKVWALLDEEPLELINGWLVWKEMTEPEERRVAGIIQEILSLAARFAHFGQAYPDLLDCRMVTGNIYKPDVCVLSNKRFETKVVQRELGSDSTVLKGSPEWVVEIRSPSNRRTKEKKKRKEYFDSGAEVIWDVYHEKRKIWVFEVEDPENGIEYGEEDEISCERFLPGWSRKVADFFAYNLTPEQIVGQPAEEWRADAEQKALRDVLMLQAKIKFGGTGLPESLLAQLQPYNLQQLTGLVATIATAETLDEWLAAFPR